MGPASGPRRADRDQLRPTAVFVLIALGWTWSLGFATVALGAGAGHLLHLLSLLGPLLGWGWAVGGVAPAGGVRPFLRRVLDVRALPLSTWVAVLLVGAGPALVAAAVVTVSGGRAVVESGLTPGVFLGVAAFALAAGLVEEPGWRGVAQDGFGARHHWVPAALVLGVLWSSWHLPLYVIEGTYQHGLGVGTEAFWLSMAIRVPLAVLLVWVVRLGRGVVGAAVLAHALGNVMGEVLSTPSSAMWWELLVVSAAAAAVVVPALRRGG